MPIRFACPHCRQKLSVSTRRAGQEADCPRCKRTLSIPEPEPETRDESASAALVAPPTLSSADQSQVSAAAPFESLSFPSPPIAAALASHDFAHDQDYEQLELVYDAPDELAVTAPQPAPPDLVAVPRIVLYLQGGLLAVVALASFAIGLIAGGALSGGGTTPSGPRACTLEGTIHYASGNRHLPDPGAVVAVIPDRGVRPDEKAPVQGLRPDDATPDESHRGLAILRQLGGSYSRTDDRGRFQVRVPDRGKYLVLVISHSRSVESRDDISTADLVKLGPFFDDAADLLGRRRYQLTMETVKADQQLNVVFE